MKRVAKIFPFLRWWPMVNRTTTRADLMAGLAGAILGLPQGVAFAILAGLPPESRPPQKQIAVTVPARSFRRLTEKIVRGIYYLHGSRFIEPPFTIEHYVLSDTGAVPLTGLLRDRGQDFAHEPGILVRRAVAAEDATSGVFSIEVWKSFKLYAVVVNKCLNDGHLFYRSAEFTVQWLRLDPLRYQPDDLNAPEPFYAAAKRRNPAASDLQQQL